MAGSLEGSASARAAGSQSSAAVPSDVTTAAFAAFDARDPQADVATLVSDSLDDPGADPDRRQLCYAFGDREIQVSVLAGSEDGQARMVVDVHPPDGTLEVQTRAGDTVVVVPVLPGRWLISPPCSGLVSFVVLGGPRRLATEWTRF